MIFIVLALFHSNKRAIFHLFLSSPELSQCPRCAGEIWNCSFISTVRPTVHANPSRKRSFWKTLFKPEEFENTSFSLSCGGKTFYKRSFSKRLRRDNLVISMTEFSSNTNPKSKFLLRCLDGKHLMRFQSESSVFKFSHCSMAGAFISSFSRGMSAKFSTTPQETGFTCATKRPNKRKPQRAPYY